MCMPGVDDFLKFNRMRIFNMVNPVLACMDCRPAPDRCRRRVLPSELLSVMQLLNRFAVIVG